MIKNIVCNSSCIIALERIGHLEILLKSVEIILIPEAVQKEIGNKIKKISVKTVKNIAVVSSLCTQIGDGESEAIALALEISNIHILLDDKKARRIAKELSLKVIGTIGLILRAKDRGIISEIKPILDNFQEVGFRISGTLYSEAMRIAKEY
ncbi:DUF3368 domain-containing protein [candidate division KSB1 bacterium]|nr:DUF3368 domain-containing protein [candidate division KSB1 bacterium]